MRDPTVERTATAKSAVPAAHLGVEGESMIGSNSGLIERLDRALQKLSRALASGAARSHCLRGCLESPERRAKMRLWDTRAT
jgi:hypothetical protein